MKIKLFISFAVMATSSPEINDLPVEMLVEILEKLPLPDIVAYCVKVCPEWKLSLIHISEPTRPY